MIASISVREIRHVQVPAASHPGRSEDHSGPARSRAHHRRRPTPKPHGGLCQLWPPSWRVHSTYQRCLCDLPWQGRIIQIHVRRHAIPIIPDTLLRLILRTPAPPRPTPPVLGLDDWAYHKRHRNGTILVDLA